MEGLSVADGSLGLFILRLVWLVRVSGVPVLVTLDDSYVDGFDTP